MPRAYEYRHVVGFEDTNLVGNVYFANHIRWQGRCREMFLHEYAPDVLADMKKNLCLITTSCSCVYLHELVAFDEVVIKMFLTAINTNSLKMSFQYFCPKLLPDLVAKGAQEVAFMRREGGTMVPTPMPIALRDALQQFA